MDRSIYLMELKELMPMVQGDESCFLDPLILTLLYPQSISTNMLPRVAAENSRAYAAVAEN
jgi:hypothetical protein